MKGHIFTEEERATLLKHKHVARVTAHTVSFTPAFKKFALTENVEKGETPTRYIHYRKYPRVSNREQNPRKNRWIVEKDCHHTRHRST